MRPPWWLSLNTWRDRSNHGWLGRDHDVIVILDQIEMVFNFSGAWLDRVLRLDWLAALGAQDNFSGCTSILTRIVIVEDQAKAKLEAAKTMSLGPCTVLTCDQARTRAITIIAAVKSGEDPAADRAAKRNAATVSDLADRFDKEHIAVRLIGKRPA